MSAKAQTATPDSTTSGTAELDDHILRQILCSVEGNAQLSQRQLSSELGIALGSVNWYLKRCISKGLIKISQVPLKRYMYFLTPQGMDEKGRLMAQYLKWSLDFFRLGREESAEILSRCAQQGQRDIVLAGDSDFAEIFIMSAMDSPVTIHAIFENGHKEGKRLRVPVVGLLPDRQAVYILTDMTQPQSTWNFLRAQGIAEEAIIIPKLLYFRPAVQEVV